MRKLLLLGLLPLVGRAQAPTRGTWGAGLALGNGVAVHGGYLAAGHWLVLGRARGKWWGPAAGPGSKWISLFESLNTHSRQYEGALLGGYAQPLGSWLTYGAAGLGYVAGRQLGEYRYSLRGNGLLFGDATHYYAYRDYQALGVPLEVSVLAPPFARADLRLGLSFQANLNPEQSVYCLLLSIWPGKFGSATR